MDDVRIVINDNIKMTAKKLAAQAVHAALFAYGIPHGRVIVLGGSKSKVLACDTHIADAGWTELPPGTVTAGASRVPSDIAPLMGRLAETIAHIEAHRQAHAQGEAGR